VRALLRRALAVSCLVPGLIGAQGPDPIALLQNALSVLPPNFFDLSDVDIITKDDGEITISALTSFMGARTQVMVSIIRGRGVPGYIIGLRPDHWSLTEMFPQIANPALEGLTLSNVALILTDQDRTRSAAEMDPQTVAFYQALFGTESFELTLKPGVNLLAGIETGDLAADHPLRLVTNALGVEQGNIFLQGTLGKSLAMLGNPAAGGLDVIKDLYLRAELPPMRPPGSPDWFTSGQLALELTGAPSVRLVGEMGVKIKSDDLDFFLAAALAKTGVSLAGGLKAERPWVAPFDITWLTLNKVVLKLGVTATGSVALGFAGDMVIGAKDMDVAVSLALSPTIPPVPTNFIVQGASESGFGLSDLVELQQRMAAARSASNDGPATGAPHIDLEALPNVYFRDVALKFAPKPDLDLGVERGMAIKGRLLLPTGDNGKLEDFAGVDVNVGEEGIWARGDVDAFQLGPLSMSASKFDLTATPTDQHLTVKGTVELFSTRSAADVSITKSAFHVHTRTRLFNLFGAQLDADGAINLRSPAFRVDAVADNELSSVLSPIVGAAVLRFAATGKTLVAQADAVISGVRSALAVAQATESQLRASLEQQRRIASDAYASRAAAATAAARQVATAKSARDRAHDLWDDTPARQVKLRAQRHASYLQRAAEYTAAAGRYTAAAAGAEAARRILAALPPVDRNALVVSAEAGIAELRSKLEASQALLESIRDSYAAVIDAADKGGTLLSVDRAEAHANLEALLRGQAVRWGLSGTFVNQPYTVEEEISFKDPALAAAQLFTALVNR